MAFCTWQCLGSLSGFVSFHITKDCISIFGNIGLSLAVSGFSPRAILGAAFMNCEDLPVGKSLGNYWTDCSFMKGIFLAMLEAESPPCEGVWLFGRD